MSLPAPAARALLAIGAYAAVSALLFAVRDSYWHALLPLIGLGVDALLPAGFARSTLDIVSNNGQQLFHLGIATVAPLRVGANTVPVGEIVNGTTPALYALQHPALIYATLVAWPCRSVSARMLLLALGVPAVIAATLLDLPFVLTGLLHELLLQANVTEVASRSMVVYYEFVHRGGRAALAIAIAVATALALGSRASLEAAGTSASMAEPAGAAALRAAETPSAANRA